MNSGNPHVGQPIGREPVGAKRQHTFVNHRHVAGARADDQHVGGAMRCARRAPQHASPADLCSGVRGQHGPLNRFVRTGQKHRPGGVREQLAHDGHALLGRLTLAVHRFRHALANGAVMIDQRVAHLRERQPPQLRDCVVGRDRADAHTIDQLLQLALVHPAIVSPVIHFSCRQRNCGLAYARPVRQILSKRFLMTLVALLALLGVATWITRSNSHDKPQVTVGEPAGRSVDFIALVQTAQLPTGFAMIGGRANADIYLTIDATRTMLVKAGTPGEIECPLIGEPSQCIVAADLLGDGVLWFSLIPGTSGAVVPLPAVVELLPGGWVRLANDWVVQHAPKVERSCADETTSLTNFIETYGDTSTSSYNVEQQRIVRVTCPRRSTSTTTTSPATSVATTESTTLASVAP